MIRQASRSGDLELLKTAIALLARAAAADPSGPAGYAGDLGAALTYFHELTGDESVLEGAIRALREALARKPGNPKILSNLGLCLTRRFEHTDDKAHLADAISTLRASVTAAEDSGAQTSSALANLGLALVRWSERTDDSESAIEAVSVHTSAVERSQGGPSVVAAMLANLGAAHLTVYQTSGDERSLEAAIGVFRNAVDTVPSGDVNAPGCFDGLGNALIEAVVAGRDIGRCLEAIEVLRRALAGLSADDPDGPLFLDHLAVALRMRFSLTGDTVALEEAIECRREAVRRASGPAQLAFQTNLGLLLRNKFEYTADPAAAHEARDILRRVADTLPEDHPGRAKAEADYANVLHRLGGSARDADVLGEAAGILRRIVAEMAPENTDRERHLANLGSVLSTLVEVGWDPADYSEAVDVLTRVLSPVGPPTAAQAEILLNLGLVHRTCFRQTRSTEAHAAAVAALDAAAGTVTAPGRIRALSSQYLAGLHAAVEDHAAAVAAFGTALELLDLVAWRGLARDDQERMLLEFSGLGSSAAASALAIGDPDGAFGLLEQGRGVLLGQLMDLRADHEQLRLDAPELERELQRANAAIEQPRGIASAAEDAPAGPLRGSAPDVTAELQRHAVQRRDVLARIRKRPGFERFLLAPDPTDLRDAARDGPVVALNLTPTRCDALVMTLEGAEAVPLPDLTAADAFARVRTFVAAVNANAWGTNDTIREILGWMWETVAAPVFDHLGYSESDGSTPPRLWWMPTGMLSVLPMHAAGHHARGDGDRRSALHRAVSSYTPTLRILRYAQGRPMPDEGRPALVVAVGNGADPLAEAAAEAATVASALPGPATTPQLDAQATREAVLDRLGSAGRVHFACHATSDAARPSDSCLHLADGPLRVRDINALRIHGASTAYLAACTTTLPGGRLPDETIHISAAFQLAGFPTTVGTLWRVPDRASHEITASTYAALQDVGPARAVNLAARRLRERYRANPYEWAAYVHSGVR